MPRNGAIGSCVEAFHKVSLNRSCLNAQTVSRIEVERAEQAFVRVRAIRNHKAVVTGACACKSERGHVTADYPDQNGRDQGTLSQTRPTGSTPPRTGRG